MKWMLPFAVIERATGEAVGMTTYMNVDAANRRLEIGSTWYRKRVQRTALNTECKLLLLQHAFETVGCVAVEFRTSTLNVASRRAIERLGGRRIVDLGALQGALGLLEPPAGDQEPKHEDQLPKVCIKHPV
jgi:RimJ/RimL family protein N-acetyltransferase